MRQRHEPFLEAPPRLGARPSPDVSVLVVCRNAERPLRASRERLLAGLDALQRAGWPAEAVLEHDGSTDATGALLDEMARGDARVQALHFAERKGKGGGLRCAAESARGRFLVMLDADFPVEPAALVEVVRALAQGHEVVVPSRRHPASEVRGVPLARRAASRAFNALANLLLGLRVHDTQCGVKGFTRRAFEAAKPRRFLGYSMDLEMLCRARRAGLRVLEVPLRYHHGRHGEFRLLRDGPRLLAELLAVRRALRGGAFDPVPLPRAAPAAAAAL